MSPKGVDLLEAYCDEESQLTKHVIQRGGRAVRFTKRDGDVSAPEGQEILWAWIHLLEPKNVWVAPECRHWGNFSREVALRCMTKFKGEGCLISQI